MEVNFNKYHGCGNDFIIIDYQEGLDFSDFAKKVCHRYIGIGADGLIVVKKDPLEMIFYNQDGSRGTMCGNGIRCFGKYCLENKIVTNNEFAVQTLAGVMLLTTDKKNIKVNMGVPSYSTEKLQMNVTTPSFVHQYLYNYMVSAVFIGTIHVVVFVDDLEEIIKTDLGAKICYDPIFKDHANVDFVEVVDRNNFKVRTYERGVGWTLACGTGASASFVIGHLDNKCDGHVNIHFPYGVLYIEKDLDNNIFMSGGAEKICSGVYDLKV